MEFFNQNDLKSSNPIENITYEEKTKNELFRESESFLKNHGYSVKRDNKKVYFQKIQDIQTINCFLDLYKNADIKARFEGRISHQGGVVLLFPSVIIGPLIGCLIVIIYSSRTAKKDSELFLNEIGALARKQNKAVKIDLEDTIAQAIAAFVLGWKYIFILLAGIVGIAVIIFVIAVVIGFLGTVIK